MYSYHICTQVIAELKKFAHDAEKGSETGKTGFMMLLATTPRVNYAAGYVDQYRLARAILRS